MSKLVSTPYDESIFAQYVRHADILRTWFVAYGVGGIVLFFAKDTAFTSIPKDVRLYISEWFMIAVAAQVVLAFFNKVYNFHLYQKSLIKPKTVLTEKDVRNNSRYFYFVDVLLDVVTVVSFAMASFSLFLAIRSMAA